MAITTFEQNGKKISFAPVVNEEGALGYEVSDGNGNVVQYAVETLVHALLGFLFDKVKNQL